MKKYQLNTVELVHSSGFPIANRPHIYQTITGPNGPHIYQTIAGRGKKEKKGENEGQRESNLGPKVTKSTTYHHATQPES